MSVPEQRAAHDTGRHYFALTGRRGCRGPSLSIGRAPREDFAAPFFDCARPALHGVKPCSLVVVRDALESEPVMSERAATCWSNRRVNKAHVLRQQPPLSGNLVHRIERRQFLRIDGRVNSVGARAAALGTTRGGQRHRNAALCAPFFVDVSFSITSSYRR